MKVSAPGEPEDESNRPGDQPNEEDAARERSLQLGGGVPIGGFFRKYLSFLGEVRDEMRKVTWPTRKMVVTETIVVIVITIFFTLMITSLDNVLATFFNWLLFGKKLPWQL